jgi:UrcA family protein
VTLLACAATAAQADTLSASTDVAYGDLNIAQASDARVLANRLHAAATAVCVKANEGAANSREGEVAVQHCVDMAISSAIATIQSRMERSVRMNLASYTQ